MITTSVSPVVSRAQMAARGQGIVTHVWICYALSVPTLRPVIAVLLTQMVHRVSAKMGSTKMVQVVYPATLVVSTAKVLSTPNVQPARTTASANQTQTSVFDAARQGIQKT
jgi:hypothetical protein